MGSWMTIARLTLGINKQRVHGQDCRLGSGKIELVREGEDSEGEDCVDFNLYNRTRVRKKEAISCFLQQT